MKKIVISIVSFIVSMVVAFLIVIGFSIYKDLKAESAIVKEIQEINTFLQQDEIDYDKINPLLERTITEGDARLVELAAKLYLKDYINAYSKIVDIVNDEEMKYLLTTKNYEDDGPEFKKTKDYIEKSHRDLILYRDNFLYFYEEEKIMSYLNTNDDYYIEFYRDEIFGNMRDVTPIKDSVNEVINSLEVAQEVYTLLSNNKDKWYIKDNKIYLNDDILDTYNDLIKSIIKIDEHITDKILGQCQRLKIIIQIIQRHLILCSELSFHLGDHLNSGIHSQSGGNLLYIADPLIQIPLYHLQKIIIHLLRLASYHLAAVPIDHRRCRNRNHQHSQVGKKHLYVYLGFPLHKTRLPLFLVHPMAV